MGWLTSLGTSAHRYEGHCRLNGEGQQNMECAPFSYRALEPHLAAHQLH